MAGYDPYEQYWQGVPQRGNVKQPTGLAMLLNAVLGNLGPGYQQGMQQQGLQQEQQLRNQQMQTNQLQMKKLQDEMEWEPIKRQMEVSKEYGGEVTLTPEQRAIFQKKGLSIPEGPMTAMSEQKLLATIQMHDSRIAQLDGFLEHKKTQAQQMDEHLKRVDMLKGKGVDVAEERNRLIEQANTIKQELGQAETARKILNDKNNTLKMSAKDMFSTDKLSAMYWQDAIRKGEKTPQQFLEWQMASRTGPAMVAAGARQVEGEAERIRKAKEDYSKELQIIDSTLKDLEGLVSPNTPIYQNIQTQKNKRKRETFERYKAIYPTIIFPDPVGTGSAISQSGQGVTK